MLNYWQIIYHNSCHWKLNNALQDLCASSCSWPEQRLWPLKMERRSMLPWNNTAPLNHVYCISRLQSRQSETLCIWRKQPVFQGFKWNQKIPREWLFLPVLSLLSAGHYLQFDQSCMGVQARFFLNVSKKLETFFCSLNRLLCNLSTLRPDWSIVLGLWIEAQKLLQLYTDICL